MYDFKFVNRSRQIAFHETDVHLRKVVNYAFTNSTKNLYFGSFLNRFSARYFKLCHLIISCKSAIFMPVLATLIKFYGYCNIENILNGKHSFFFFFFFLSVFCMSGLIFMSLKNLRKLCKLVERLVLLANWKKHSELRRKIKKQIAMSVKL